MSNHKTDACREETRRRAGPGLFGWSLLGMSTLAAFAKAEGPRFIDLPALGEEEAEGYRRLLHWVAHCGLGGRA